jgi:hypothetical protein
LVFIIVKSALLALLLYPQRSLHFFLEETVESSLVYLKQTRQIDRH